MLIQDELRDFTGLEAAVYILFMEEDIFGDIWQLTFMHLLGILEWLIELK